MNSLVKQQAIALCLALILYASTLVAQTTGNYSLVDNLNPVTPTRWQFSKYTDMPVSEYTGVPNISIPIYEIDEDGVKIPLILSYHAAGIKVNEESSWVGLGWDMTAGSIVQEISDQDDYAARTHLEPDYYNSGTPSIFPLKYEWNVGPSGSADNVCSYGCSGPISIPPLAYADGIEIYTNQYAPFGGDYGYHLGQNYLNFFDSHDVSVGYSIDSEPDVFTASFFGHSFRFIRNPANGTIVVLDKKGYQVSHPTTAEWVILSPSGDEYDFTVEDVVQSYSQSDQINGTLSNTELRPSSNIWMLTKIISKNHKVITFNYTQTAQQFCYPTFTQKGIAATLQTTLQSTDEDVWANFCQSSDISANYPSTRVCSTQSFSYEQYTYLSSVTFPNGSINFSLSTRNDLRGGLKLDSIEISSSSQEIKSWAFNYTYLNSSGVGGHTFSFTDTANFGSYPMNRLSLSSIKDNSGSVYAFTYNSTLLPAKNSFATDYWGYYNGDLANTSVVPNPTQFKQTGFYASSDNHSANLTYTQAGILTKIQYPTGGSVNFTYALNQFSNYWVPDYASNTNTVSSGDGLRVQSIVWKDASGNQLKQTNYTYNAGMASLPINFFRSYTFSETPPGNLTPGVGDPILQRSFLINETNVSGAFTANPFASFNGVGYSQVIKTDVDNLGNTNGKVISNYYNQPDLVYNSITTAQQTDPTLPAYKNPLDTADNGSLKSELYYNRSNTLEKTVSYNYTNIFSPLFYGARMMEYASLARYMSGSYVQDAKPQTMICYYPIFDFQSLVTGVTETEYFGSNAIASTTSNSYDSYNQLKTTSKTNSTFTKTTQFTYPYNYTTPAVLDSMTAHNRLMDIVTATTSSPNSTTRFSRGYQQQGSLFVAHNDTSYINLSYNPAFTTYDRYDLTNGNIMQFSRNAVPNAVLWDYNKEYVIANITNALYSNVAYTSFEADGTGRWKFSGTTAPDPNAPTGQKSYSLAGGSIYRDSLDATLTYVVSYWSKSGAQTVSGATATITGYSLNGYTYYESTVPTPSAGTITISGTGTIDELRLYPNTAQMTTYTYAPLVGITSEGTTGGKINYYEYDNSMRLLDVRDQNKNILKAYCYNYAGEPTTCGLNITYSNVAASQVFTKNTCDTANYVPSQVTYTVPIGKYVSTMSLDDANNQAQEDISANGQTYANTNGSCYLKINFTLTSSTSDGYQVNFSNSTFNYTFNFKAPGTSTVRIPTGMYTVDVYPTGAYHNHTFTLGTRTPIPGVPRTYFYNVNVATGSTDVSLTIQ